MDGGKDLGLICAWKEHQRHQLSLTPNKAQETVICLEAVGHFRLT